MDNRINIDQIILNARKENQTKYIIISAIGIVLPFALWVFYLTKLEPSNLKIFLTIVIIVLMILSLIFGVVNLIRIYFELKNYKNVLIKYATLIEKIQIPETAIVTSCYKSGEGRFGFDVINYHFWLEENELIFYPVCPEYRNHKSYNLVQAIRLDKIMIRSFYITGNQFYLVNSDQIKEETNFENLTTNEKKRTQPVYRDTRATTIDYAVGDQTVYLTFSVNLYEKLKELIPDKDEVAIKKVADAKKIEDARVIIDNEFKKT